MPSGLAQPEHRMKRGPYNAVGFADTGQLRTRTAVITAAVPCQAT